MTSFSRPYPSSLSQWWPLYLVLVLGGMVLIQQYLVLLQQLKNSHKVKLPRWNLAKWRPENAARISSAPMNVDNRGAAISGQAYNVTLRRGRILMSGVLKLPSK